MVLTPRCPNTENVLCRHDETSGTCEAGAIVYLSGDKKIAKVAASGNVPYGLLGQRVKANAAGLPQGFEFPGEQGASDARLGDPVCLFHGGIFDTDFYHLPAGVTAGAALYARTEESENNAKLVTTATGVALGLDGQPAKVAVAMSSLSTAEATAKKPLLVKMLI